MDLRTSTPRHHTADRAIPFNLDAVTATHLQGTLILIMGPWPII